MKRQRQKKILGLSAPALTVILLLIGCSGSTALRTAPADETSGLTGTFRLILYGTAQEEGLERVAFLDVEGDVFKIEPYAPDFQYVVLDGLQGNAALERALQFVSSHPAYYQSVYSKITTPEGRMIGYEVRPLYRYFVYGMEDVLQINYFLAADNKVKAVVRLDPSLERSLHLSPSVDSGPAR